MGDKRVQLCYDYSLRHVMENYLQPKTLLDRTYLTVQKQATIKSKRKPLNRINVQQTSLSQPQSSPVLHVLCVFKAVVKFEDLEKKKEKNEHQPNSLLAITIQVSKLCNQIETGCHDWRRK